MAVPTLLVLQGHTKNAGYKTWMGEYHLDEPLSAEFSLPVFMKVSGKQIYLFRGSGGLWKLTYEKSRVNTSRCQFKSTTRAESPVGLAYQCYHQNQWIDDLNFSISEPPATPAEPDVRTELAADLQKVADAMGTPDSLGLVIIFESFGIPRAAAQSYADSLAVDGLRNLKEVCDQPAEFWTNEGMTDYGIKKFDVVKIQKGVAAREHNLNAPLQGVDTNNDGVIDKDEWAAAGGTEEEFRQIDRNGDGAVDVGELTAPRVVISYQSAQHEFLIRLRTALNGQHGIATVDGTQVPPGFDWRNFYFSAAEQCEVLVPILSREFLFSGACDDELTYAKDKGLVIMPVVFDFEGYMDVMTHRENYLDKCPQLRERVPKYESILNRCNRIPPNTPFDGNFEDNVQLLAEGVHRCLRLKPRFHSANVKGENKNTTAVQPAKAPISAGHH